MSGSGGWRAAPWAWPAAFGYGLALLLRAVAAGRVPVINPDGAVELALAEALRSGRWSDALELHFHPLYAGLVALGAGATGADPEAVATVASAVVSAGVAPACAVAGAALCPQRPRDAALAGAVFAACHPYLVRLGGQVMAYGVAHACLAVALAAALLAWRSGRVRWAAAAGAAVGLGYLARSDALATGLGLGLGMTAAWLLAARRSGRPGQRVGLPVAFAFAALAVASPYLIAMRVHTGEWRLSLKKRVDLLVEAPPDPASEAAPAPPAAPSLQALVAGEQPRAATTGRLGRLAAARYAGHVSLAVAHPLLAVLALLGLIGAAPRARWVPRWPRPPGWVLPLLAWGVFLAVHALLKASPWGYTSRIHQSATGVLVAPLAARGLVLWAGHPVLGRARAAAALAVAVAILVPKAIEPQRTHLAVERELGVWLRQDALRRGAAADLTVCGHDSRVVAHYAGARFVPLPGGSPAKALAEARALGARYLAVRLSGRGPARGDLVPALAVHGVTLARPPVERVRSEGGKRYTWWVFWLGESPGSSSPR